MVPYGCRGGRWEVGQEWNALPYVCGEEEEKNGRRKVSDTRRQKMGKVIR